MSPAFMNLPASMANRPLLVPGVPFYVFGTYSAKTSPTLLNITNISASVNTVTISATITAGNVPTTAQLLTVQNASVSSVNAIAATVTAVTGFDTGDNSTGTVSYTVTGVGTVASAAGSGQVVMPVAVIPDVLSTMLNNSDLTVYSQQVALPYNDPRIDQSRTIVVQVQFSSVPEACVVTLQASDDDVNYWNVATVITVTSGVPEGGLTQATFQSANFYRLAVTGLNLGSPPSAASIQASLQA